MFSIKDFLLLGRERCIKDFGGLAALVSSGAHIGCVLGAQGAHFVDALWCRQFVKLRALCRRETATRAGGLHGCREAGPGAFLCRCDLEFGLHIRLAFGDHSLYFYRVVVPPTVA